MGIVCTYFLSTIINLMKEFLVEWGILNMSVKMKKDICSGRETHSGLPMSCV